MKDSKKALLRIVNRITYITSAALLLAAFVLGAVASPAYASTGDDCGPCESPYQLNLSHVACDFAKKQVEVHFVLLDVPNGTTPGILYFNVKINGGSEMTYYISAPTKHTGNVWHYSYYFTGTGTYDVISARVTAGSVFTYLHNPGSVTVNDEACVVETPIPTTETVVPTTETVVPTTETVVPTTETVVPTTETVEPTTETVEPTTETVEPTTETVEPTTETVEPTTETVEPTTETVEPTTETVEPTTETVEPTTETVVPTTETVVPTTETVEPTTETPIPPTETVAPTDVPTDIPTEGPTTPPEIFVPESPSVSVDPYCTTNNQMQWTIENPNSKPFTISSWSLDGETHGGFTAAPGSNKITTSSLGTHTLIVYWGEGQSSSLTYTIDVCPMSIPVTGAEVGGVLIPVTGADDLATGALFAGISLGGLALILTALRKYLHL
jgi:hypothetical protein